MPADSSKKLTGKTILVPRPAPPAGQTDKLADLLQKAGAKVIAHPVIKLAPVPLPAIQEALEQIHHFRTIVFVSASGVRFFASLLDKHNDFDKQHGIGRYFDELQIAAIGTATAAEVEKLGLRVNFVPERADSQSLASGLARQMQDPFLLIRADRGSSVLSEALTKDGKEHQELVVYESQDVDQADPHVLELLQNNQIDWIAFTSPAIALASIRMFKLGLRNTRLATISSSVTQVLEENEFEVAAEAVRPGFEEIVEAIGDAFDNDAMDTE